MGHPAGSVPCTAWRRPAASQASPGCSQQQRIGALVAQQRDLGLDAARRREPAEPGRADDPVAGDEDGDRVPAAGRADILAPSRRSPARSRRIRASGRKGSRASPRRRPAAARRRRGGAAGRRPAAGSRNRRRAGARPRPAGASSPPDPSLPGPSFSESPGQGGDGTVLFGQADPADRRADRLVSMALPPLALPRPYQRSGAVGQGEARTRGRPEPL